MDPASTGQVVVFAILICLSAFFSSSETALMAVNKIRLRNLIEEGNKKAEIVSSLIENPSKLLGAILVGNNVVNIGASSLATAIAIDLFGSKGVGIATGFVTLIVLVFGEITPKSLAAENAERIALLVARPIQVISAVLMPIVVLLLSFTNRFIKLLGGKVDEVEPLITEDELKTMVSVSHEEGVLELDERDMIVNIFDFGDSLAKDVMTPRTDMIAIDVESSYDEILDTFVENQFSRIPVYEDDTDTIIGVLSVKDFIRIQDREHFDLHDFIREPVFVFESQKTFRVFERMRAEQASISIVVDEYGGTAGLISIEDMVEEIVGEIDDEHDETTHDIVPVGSHGYAVEGTVRIEDLNDVFHLNIANDDFDTIAGFVLENLARIPSEGDSFHFDGISYRVLEMDKNRVEKVLMTLPESIRNQ